MNARFRSAIPSTTHKPTSTMSPDTLIEFTANVHPVVRVPRLASATRGILTVKDDNDQLRSVLTGLVAHLSGNKVGTVSVTATPPAARSSRSTWRRTPFPLPDYPNGTRGDLHVVCGQHVPSKLV